MVDAYSGSETATSTVRPEVLVGTRLSPFLMFLAGAGLAALGVDYAGSGKPGAIFVGWLFAVLFGGASFGYLWMVVRPPQIHLDRTGFTLVVSLFGLPERRYNWGDIKGFSRWDMRRSVFVAISLEPHARKKSWLAGAPRAKLYDILLPSGWELEPGHLVDYLNAYRLKALASQQATPRSDPAVDEHKLAVH